MQPQTTITVSAYLSLVSAIRISPGVDQQLQLIGLATLDKSPGLYRDLVLMSLYR